MCQVASAAHNSLALSPGITEKFVLTWSALAPDPHLHTPLRLPQPLDCLSRLPRSIAHTALCAAIPQLQIYPSSYTLLCPAGVHSGQLRVTGSRRHGEGTSHFLLVAVLAATPPRCSSPEQQQLAQAQLLQLSLHWEGATVTSWTSELSAPPATLLSNNANLYRCSFTLRAQTAFSSDCFV